MYRPSDRSSGAVDHRVRVRRGVSADQGVAGIAKAANRIDAVRVASSLSRSSLLRRRPMGLKILTSVKLFLYDCQNNFFDPARSVFAGLPGDPWTRGPSARVTANEAEVTRRNETDVP